MVKNVVAQRDTVFYYPDGTPSSKGVMVDGRPDGYWQTFYPDGTLRSKGNRIRTLLDGIWTFYDENGKKEKEIHYVAGIKQGDELFYENGVLKKRIPYDKNIKQGISHSYHKNGKISRQDHYKNDQIYGRSLVYDSTGVIISIIQYKDGIQENIQNINRRDSRGQKNGLWVWFYDDTSQVEHQGTYSRGLRHGFFRYYDREGHLLRSEKYIDDVLEENAIETSDIAVKREYYPDKRLKSYISTRGGKKEGLSIYYSPNESVDSVLVYSDGILKERGENISSDGLKSGLWNTYSSDGKIISQGAYKDGKKESVWEYYYPDGQLLQRGEYISSAQNGTWNWYYPDGAVMRVENYENGLREGPSIQYDALGNVISQGQYRDDMRIGKWYFITDDTKDEGHFVDGQKNGLWIQTDIESGKKVSSIVYREGVPNGECTMYYVDGRKRAEGFFSDGQRDGLWRFYDTDERLIVSVSYSSGIEVSYDNVSIYDTDDF